MTRARRPARPGRWAAPFPPVPDALSARRTMVARQWLLPLLSLTALGLGLAFAWRLTVTVLLAAGTFTFALALGYKARLVLRARRRGLVPRRVPLLDHADLPYYTVLVPLYHEAAMVEGLVRHLGSMDYPEHRLEVLLLCEWDDDDTVLAVRALDLPPTVRLVVVPQGTPKTKPRACNFGLRVATGDLLVIYDAEDRPERDQLRLAASVFAQSADFVVCLQARLDYHNHDQNWLTRFFANEYNHWFDLLLPALAAARMPIPLGGTSNHFRIAALRGLGGWDAFNVTEDADLGMRLWAAGHDTDVIDSITWEEAVCRVGPWLRQRTRWVKGYLQTHLVHSRPADLLARPGRRVSATVTFLALIGGTPLVNLINPLFWALFLYHLVTRAPWVAELMPAPLLYLAVASFLFGNLSVIVMNLAAAEHRGRWHLAGAAVLAPLYWLMMSVATWRAVWQLAVAPHRWEKTPHGIGADVPEMLEVGSRG